MPTGPVTPQDAGTDRPRTRKSISTHWLYVAVIVAMVAGTAVGLIFGRQAAGLAVLGTAFVNLIKMIIGPIIFCTIVLAIGSVNKASHVGRVGGIALLYFVVMSTFALAPGPLVGNLVHPGEGLQDIIPTTLFSAPTIGSVLQALFVGLVVGFAAQALGAIRRRSNDHRRFS